MRSILVLLHRYIGLATAIFLFLAGITGSILAFHHELDEWLNPEFYHTTSEGPVLAPGTLVERVEQANPRMQVWYMEFPSEPGHAALMALVPRDDPATGKPYDERPVVHYLDAVTGEPVGTRHWGECCFSRKNFVPFILEFHYNLSLPGNWGLWLMGIVAIAWVIDCFVSLVLTFPRGRPFFSKWWTAWKIKRQRMNHDVHRAGGLWLWLLLTPVAVSSVAMNLPEQVFKPVVSLFSPVEPSVYEARGRMPADQLGTTAYDFHQAYDYAMQHAAELGLTEAITELYYSFEYNFYGAGFGEHDSNQGNAWLFFHGTDGRLLGQEIPGQGTLGQQFHLLQPAIHGGRILGLPGRILIAVLGVAIAVLSVTGVVIWWRKRRARISASLREPRRGNAASANPVGEP
ncbi:PepSY-associated TM helix domain-containing protein [Stutzerimonas stutzeri]|uniref:PepSY-associated TM helix domain-containing protein n=1 Tax=Stutzerimonas stutzeri TaxID=316 RepID=UPI000303231E|nr:PepSY domain-containing protein [Stutzerimonas stutzeri]